MNPKQHKYIQGIKPISINSNSINLIFKPMKKTKELTLTKAKALFFVIVFVLTVLVTVLFA